MRAGTGRLRIRIDSGRFRVESFGYSHPDIELKQIGTRIADLPINAGVLDALAIQKLFSAEEIAESGLAARVVEAQEKAIQAVERAAVVGIVHACGTHPACVLSLIRGF